ncbi:MAG: peptidyl-prolyl cis-trans isomerase [Candidatus Aminicenantales bacterium]
MNSKFRSAVLPALAALLALSALLALAGPACRRDKGSSAGAAAPRETAPKKSLLILQVGESSYSGSDFDSYIRHTLGQMEEPLSASTLSRLYDRFCEDKLILEQARQQHIGLTEEEMKKYLVKVKGQLEPAKRTEFSDSDLKSLRDKLLADKYTYLLVKDIAVSDEEIKAFYEGHKSDFLQPERFEVYQILVESEEKAVEVLDNVRGRTVEEFQAMARRISIGPEAERGGRLGVFSPGQLPFEIERVVLSLPEGQISQVVESSYGYHIFLLNKRFEPEIVPLDKAAPGIRLKLLDRKISLAVSDHLAELKKRLDWKTLTQNLSFSYQRNLL